jgi:hypothetical protein
MESTRSPFVLSAAILALGLILSTLIGGGFAHNIKSIGDISVTGSAQKVITSDRAKWRISLSRSAALESLKDGYSQLKNDLNLLQAYLKKEGVDAKQITVGAISVEATYANYDMSRPAGYTLRQEVTVESSDVAKLTATVQNAGSLLTQGAVVTTNSLEYYYSKLADVKVEMLAEATENARDRAAKIAQSAGSALGKLKEASMGVLQITPVNSTEVSDYGMYDTSSIEKQITAVVRASFGVR